MSEVLSFIGDYLNPEILFRLLILLLVAWTADQISKRFLMRLVRRAVRETSFKFDDILLDYNVFGRLAHLAPALAIYYGMRWIPAEAATYDLGERIVSAVMVLITMSALTLLLTAIGRTYASSAAAEGRPIEAYTQIAKIAVYVLGIVIAIATLANKSPLILLSGIGAVTAVILLIFRDTILGFVASLQITSYDMIRVGDWIEMSQYGADGDVIELSLHTVKVQNWDKTITAIPTYKLIEQPFRNWRGMQESGGRRIKRSLHVDMTSVRFLTEDELDRLENFVVLRDYVRQKRADLAEYNAQFASDPKLVPNARRLTNVGTFRAYLVEYLRRHPKIRQDMTLLVRQLEPGPAGLPIELYTFTNTTAWGEYEDIQADVFDHVLAIVHEFGLRVFQEPAGTDLAQLTGRTGDGES